jgi:hypothetical protein
MTSATGAFVALCHFSASLVGKLLRATNEGDLVRDATQESGSALAMGKTKCQSVVM